MALHCELLDVRNGEGIGQRVELQGHDLVRPAFLHLESLEVPQRQGSDLLEAVEGQVHEEGHHNAGSQPDHHHPSLRREPNSPNLHVLIPFADVIPDDLFSDVISEDEPAVAAGRDNDGPLRMHVEGGISLQGVCGLAAMRVEDPLAVHEVVHLHPLRTERKVFIRIFTGT